MNLQGEINYMLYRLQELGENPDRIRVYRERIDIYLKEFEDQILIDVR